MQSLPSESRWITFDEIVWINEQAVAQTGEPYALRDSALLESAIARPKNRWYYDGEEDVVRLATNLLYGIAKNHAFEQGNKRTGATAALMFIEANGYRWALPDNGELAQWVLDLVVDKLSIEDMAELMRPHVK